LMEPIWTLILERTIRIDVTLLFLLYSYSLKFKWN
jgi:hypothetical protein